MCCNRKQFSLWQQSCRGVGLFANSMLRDRQGYDQGNYEIRQSSPFSPNISFSEQFKTLGLIFRLHLLLDWDTDINLLPYFNFWWRCEELRSCIINFEITESKKLLPQSIYFEREPRKKDVQSQPCILNQVNGIFCYLWKQLLSCIVDLASKQILVYKW